MYCFIIVVEWQRYVKQSMSDILIKTVNMKFIMVT